MTYCIRQRAFDRIKAGTNLADLQTIAKNVARRGDIEVQQAALRRLYEVQPSAQPGTLEYDVWRSIHALEGSLSAERGKTTWLARTRQTILRDGEIKTVKDLILGKPSEGFLMLIERNWPELTFEAVALRHPHAFETVEKAAATERLVQVGVDISKIEN